MKTMANSLPDIAGRQGEIEKAAQVPGIPTEAPGPPQMTQRAVEKKGRQRHECQRRQPRERFIETQWKRGGKAWRRYKTRRSSAARGVILARPCVGGGDVRPRECVSGALGEEREQACRLRNGPEIAGTPE